MDMKLLVERYSDDNGFVRLVPFQNDIQELVGLQQGEGFREPGPSMPLYHGDRGASLRCSRWFPLKAPPEKQRPSSARTVRSLAESFEQTTSRPASSMGRPQSARAHQAVDDSEPAPSRSMFAHRP